MGRMENAECFRDTELKCRTNQRLVAAIAESRARQRLIRERDAINRSPISTQSICQVTVSPKRTFEAAPELQSLHERRLRRILDVAASDGNEAVILGAFGCGAFRNDPSVVARAAASVIGGYRAVFKAIEFAVFCRPGDTANFDAFKSMLLR